jgi:L-lactate permease
MDVLKGIIVAVVIIYVAVCFGKIAAKHGKNPILYGILSVISPINLIILGLWAFSKSKSSSDTTSS